MAQRKVRVRNVSEVSGESNIAGRDVIKNIKTIYQRAWIQTCHTRESLWSYRP